VECDELSAVDRILEEVTVHATQPPYVEDLKTIIELLRLSHDPQVEEKILAVLNAPDTPKPAVVLLQDFVSRFRPSSVPADNPWSRADKLAALNKRYIAAAQLFDSGKTGQAKAAVDAILQDEPGYPFAAALRELTTLRS